MDRLTRCYAIGLAVASGGLAAFWIITSARHPRVQALNQLLQTDPCLLISPAVLARLPNRSLLPMRSASSVVPRSVNLRLEPCRE
jgi:hypothetical protein